MVEELQAENDLSFEELDRLSSKNREEISDSWSNPAKNKNIAIQHNQEISQRRGGLYANRQDVKAMRGSVGREIDYADIFVQKRERVSELESLLRDRINGFPQKYQSRL